MSKYMSIDVFFATELMVFADDQGTDRSLSAELMLLKSKNKQSLKWGC